MATPTSRSSPAMPSARFGSTAFQDQASGRSTHIRSRRRCSVASRHWSAGTARPAPGSKPSRPCLPTHWRPPSRHRQGELTRASRRRPRNRGSRKRSKPLRFRIRSEVRRATRASPRSVCLTSSNAGGATSRSCASSIMTAAMVKSGYTGSRTRPLWSPGSSRITRSNRQRIQKFVRSAIAPRHAPWRATTSRPRPLTPPAPPPQVAPPPGSTSRHAEAALHA